MGLRGLIFLGLDVVGVVCVTLAILTLARGSAKCPYCRSTRVRYSKPTIIDKILYVIYVRPYRCQACRKRFYARKRGRVNEQSRGAAVGSR